MTDILTKKSSREIYCSIIHNRLYYLGSIWHRVCSQCKRLDEVILSAALHTLDWQSPTSSKHSSAQRASLTHCLIPHIDEHKKKLPCPSSSSSVPRPWSPQSSLSAFSSWRPGEVSSHSCQPPLPLPSPWLVNEASPSPFSSRPCRGELVSNTDLIKVLLWREADTPAENSGHESICFNLKNIRSSLPHSMVKLTWQSKCDVSY